ncbi:glycoside hydrolase family 19 protein [Psychrobacter sp. JB193]|uniref:glycoside hydrolase family 19 protein n=1 Tax=Psychrobacter sp. JB193 TaxID=2024406 RepID=UPI00211BA10E|nr:glycoside hydrolase family 19 protein [Psychrobacter sp. JB193]
MSRQMNSHQLKMHNRALSATRRLQAQLNETPDGFWGGDSQAALLCSSKQVGYDWDKLRAHFGSFKQSQVDGFNAVLDAINKYNSDAITPAFIAYMLATAWHETAHTMLPIAEYGKGRGRKYGSNVDIDGSRYEGLPHIYYGRGYVQLTWLSNYVKMGKLLNIDLVNNPDLAMQPKHAADIMIAGMLGGLFTGLSLSRCITYGLYFEFIQARKIINGTDKDDAIADYAVNFLDSLVVS